MAIRMRLQILKIKVFINRIKQWFVFFFYGWRMHLRLYNEFLSQSHRMDEIDVNFIKEINELKDSIAKEKRGRKEQAYRIWKRIDNAIFNAQDVLKEFQNNMKIMNTNIINNSNDMINLQDRLNDVKCDAHDASEDCEETKKIYRLLHEKFCELEPELAAIKDIQELQTSMMEQRQEWADTMIRINSILDDLKNSNRHKSCKDISKEMHIVT